MSDVKLGRWTARAEGPFVVFIIGMRINRPWKLHRWLPVFLAMPRMLRELAKDPTAGFISGNLWLGRTIVMVQYWRDFEALESYAKAKTSSHLPAWRAFNQAIADNGDVGIFHETYRIAPGNYENVYVNVPPMLMGKAVTLVEAKAGLQSASARLRA